MRVLAVAFTFAFAGLETSVQSQEQAFSVYLELVKIERHPKPERERVAAWCTDLLNRYHGGCFYLEVVCRFEGSLEDQKDFDFSGISLALNFEGPSTLYGAWCAVPQLRLIGSSYRCVLNASNVCLPLNPLYSQPREESRHGAFLSLRLENTTSRVEVYFHRDLAPSGVPGAKPQVRLTMDPVYVDLPPPPRRTVEAFTDHPLVRGVTPIRAIHFMELRERIDAVRQVAGLVPFRWADRAITPGVTPVKLMHLLELRTALALAYAAEGRAAPLWMDTAPIDGVTPIRAAHLMELRAAVVALE